MKTSTRTALTFALLAGAAGAAHADQIAGLTSSMQIVRFDSANPGVLLGTSPVISGLKPGDRLADIDVYPVTGGLYGIGAATGTLYRVDPFTGVAKVDVTPLSAIGSPSDADFNPAADRLRVFSAGDANFRLTPSVNTAGPTGANAGLVSGDGTFTFGAGGADPDLVANAYTNNFDGTASTTLYSIDTGLNALVIHSGGPQFSMLAVVGALGVDVGADVGFDISAGNSAFVSNANALFSVNLATGSLSPLGTIAGPLGVTTIAIVPAPGTAGLGVLAGVGLLGRRRR